MLIQLMCLCATQQKSTCKKNVERNNNNNTIILLQKHIREFCLSFITVEFTHNLLKQKCKLSTQTVGLIAIPKITA